MPLLLACNSCLVQPQDKLRDKDNSSDSDSESETKTETLDCPSLNVQKEIEDSWNRLHEPTLPEAVDKRLPGFLTPQIDTERHPSTLSDSCSTTPGGPSTVSSSTVLVKPPHDAKTPAPSPSPSWASLNTSPVSRTNDANSASSKHWLEQCGIGCANKGKVRDILCLSSFYHYKLHPNAWWPVLISTIAGCVRQMAVPIALMFTTANAGKSPKDTFNSLFSSLPAIFISSRYFHFFSFFQPGLFNQRFRYFLHLLQSLMDWKSSVG